jgi:alpha 1,6-mannosyltransferase
MVSSYLRVKYGLLWTDLKDIREPLRIGDVVVLPVTGFSPGVGNFGAQPAWRELFETNEETPAYMM